MSELPTAQSRFDLLATPSCDASSRNPPRLSRVAAPATWSRPGASSGMRTVAASASWWQHTSNISKKFNRVGFQVEEIEIEGVYQELQTTVQWTRSNKSRKEKMMHSMSVSRDSNDVGALRRVFLAEDSPAVSVIPISLLLFLRGEERDLSVWARVSPGVYLMIQFFEFICY